MDSQRCHAAKRVCEENEGPHPEEARSAVLACEGEGWPRARRLKPGPAAIPEPVGILHGRGLRWQAQLQAPSPRPSFETRPAGAPQDEV